MKVFTVHLIYTNRLLLYTTVVTLSTYTLVAETQEAPFDNMPFLVCQFFLVNDNQKATKGCKFYDNYRNDNYIELVSPSCRQCPRFRVNMTNMIGDFARRGLLLVASLLPSCTRDHTDDSGRSGGKC